MSDRKNKTRRVAICLIVDGEDNIMMGLRKDCDKYTCPGGHLEDGEDPYKGALRELREETNLEAEDIKLVKVHWDKKVDILLYLFKIIPVSGQEPSSEFDPDDECFSWNYMDPNDVADQLHVPVERNVALKYWMNED